MKNRAKKIMMSLICLMSYGHLSFRSAYSTIYRGQEKSPLFNDIIKSVFKDEFPEDTDALSFITLSDLNQMARYLNIDPGERFADLACGRGGPGMWLARKTRSNVRGVDLSGAAVAAATRRIAQFGLSNRASFSTGSFYDTGLKNGSCHGAVCIDALWLAPDRDRALREVARILRPSANFVFTTWDGNIPFMPDDHRQNLENAGFEIQIYRETKGWKERQLAVYEKVLAMSDTLTKEMGGPAAKAIIKEARSTPAVLEKSRRILVAARKA